jgi:hypothetical protein
VSDAPIPSEVLQLSLETLSHLEDEWSAVLDPAAHVDDGRHEALEAEGSENPDGAPELDRTYRLLICQQIAASRACALRHCSGSLDDLVTALERARRARMLLRKNPLSLEQNCAMVAAEGITLYERSRIHQTHGEYEQAIYALAQAASCLSEPALSFHLHVDFDETQELIESVFRHPRGVDWKRFAETCRDLAALDDLGNTDLVSTDFRDLGHIASGRATARLTNEDQLDLIQKAEVDAAERRLRKYFYPSSWSVLPNRVREALVDADSAFLGITKGRPESTLNDLRIATEELCYHVIWLPLRRARQADNMAWFLEIEAGLKGKAPGLGTYRMVLARREYASFLTGLPRISDDLQKWLTAKQLRNDLYDLQRQRNDAEHTDRIIAASCVNDLYSTFLGIGRGHDGVLLRLAEIYATLDTYESQRPISTVTSSDAKALLARLQSDVGAFSDQLKGS